jgi:hypothetical protein
MVSDLTLMSVAFAENALANKGIRKLYGRFFARQLSSLQKLRQPKEHEQHIAFKSKEIMPQA